MADVDSDPEVQFGEMAHAGGDQMDQGQITPDAGELSGRRASNCSSPYMERPVKRKIHKEMNGQENRNRDIPEMPGLYREVPYDYEMLSQPRRGPQMKPETYNGEDDWECYRTHFELCAELSGWSQREIVLTLAASLRGQARMFYMNLSAVERSSYQTLVKKLSQRFGNSRHRAMWTSKLEARYRLPGESMAKLADEVMQLARRAHANLDSEAQEAIALNQLYKSISPELKYQCIQTGCQTVAEAVDIVDTYEGIVLEPKEGRKFKVRTVARDRESSIERLEEQIKRLTETVNQLQRKASAGDRSSDQRRCFLCQSPDHLMRDCPKNRNKQLPRRSRVETSYVPHHSSRNSEN